MSRSSPSVAALAAGVPDRYRYWYGHSRRRYLFTQTDGAALPDFAEGIAIAEQAGEILWIGEIARLAALPAGCAARRSRLSVHLLAASPEERRAVIEDLRPVTSHLRLAA
jgi:hypothetical protein